MPAPVIPGAVRKRRRGSLSAVILMITVGLAGKVCAKNIDLGRESEGETVRSPAQMYFDAVALDDREIFIKYHLDQALEKRIPDHVSTSPADFSFITYQELVEPPENFSTNLLNHFEGSFGLTEQDVYNFVTYAVVCFPQGWCFDPDDVGNVCCPF